MNDRDLLLLMIGGIIAGSIFWLWKKLRRPDITKLYRGKTILTDREYEFYTRLRPVADEYGLTVLMKVRLADLLEPKPRDENPLWMECFNKIKAKHIDFALADRDTNIIALIELDDSTHAREDRTERDIFVNAILENTGYTLLRTYGETGVIEDFLGK